MDSDSPIPVEWNYYRIIIADLLAKGHEGKWLLIKGQEVIGIWETEAEANAVRVEHFLGQAILVKQILSRKRVLFVGYNRLCRN